MNGDSVVLAVAVALLLVFLLSLLFVFVHVRLWVQALLTDAPVGIFDIIGMRLRGCPPHVLVHAAIVLAQRGRKVPAREIEGYYRAAALRGERPATAAELADLVEAVKRNEAPQT